MVGDKEGGGIGSRHKLGGLLAMVNAEKCATTITYDIHFSPDI